jgi:cellulose synthase/poly-beta-1,6-N-acetylglucosamine synthase-like glycosyltransferase
MEKLQSIEYAVAMDTRKIYPWLTSWACMIARTKVIRDIMKNHSLLFSGGDIEIVKLAKMLGYKVGHLHFEFFTDVPSTFKAWFKQRMAWFGGGFRHAVINMHQYTWRHPLFYFYTTFLVFLLTPLRWYEIRVPYRSLSCCRFILGADICFPLARAEMVLFFVSALCSDPNSHSRAPRRLHLLQNGLACAEGRPDQTTALPRKLQLPTFSR